MNKSILHYTPCIAILAMGWLIRMGTNWSFPIIYLLFSCIATMVSLQINLLSRNQLKAKSYSLILAPLTIILTFIISCLNNSEALMWAPIGGFFILLYTAPIWILSSLFMGNVIAWVEKRKPITTKSSGR